MSALRALGAAASSAIDRACANARASRVPPSAPRRELALAAHVMARAWSRRALGPKALALAATDLALIEAALLALGAGGMLADGDGLFPSSFLPDYHGPHFQRALRRLLAPHEGPFVVHLSLTGACPWTCRYCFASAGGPDAPDVGEPGVLRVAEALARQSVPIVILGGGEPLGRFERARKIIATLAPSSEVRLATSGSGLTRERARALGEAGLSVLAVSLDSHERASVDRARGSGAFDAAVSAIGVAGAAGLRTLVTAVVGREGHSEGRATALTTLVRRENPTAIVNFIPEFATGRGASDGFASPEEYAPYGRALARAIRRDSLPAAAFYAPPMDSLVGCVGAGQRQLVIDTRANLCACVSGASFGNLLQEPFDQVWARMLAAPSRLKRGYFCSAVNSERAPLPSDAAAMTRALERFHSETPDAALQALVDAAGPALARWLDG